MTYEEDTSKSQENANSFYDTHLTDRNSSEIISVVGSWGTGKSKVKEELLELINRKMGDKTITVAYDALQFEETSQVTSELYNVIAKSLSRWDFCTRNKLKAAAQLKKESAAKSISTSQIWSIFIVAFLTSLIGKLSNVPEFNSIFSDWKYIVVQNPTLGNKLITGLLIFLLIFFKRNKILRIIAGLLPRKSHIEVLESINLKQKSLIILIDEIDRLSPEATKLLFDEVLIIKDSFKKAKVKFKIIMFYDEDVVLHNYRTINVYEPHIFLQKFYDKQFRLPRVIFFDDLYEWAINIKKNNSSILHVPTAKIIRHIADNIASFREKDRLIDFLNQQCGRFISDDTIRSKPLDVDIFIFSLSLRFFFDLRNLYGNTTGKLYGIYVEKGIKILTSIYNSNSEDLKSLISGELTRLVKPYATGNYSQAHLINQVILNPNTNNYYQNIIDSLESFYWSDFSWANTNFQEFNNYLTEKKINFTALIFELSRWLQNTINQNSNARLTSERENFSIEHIKNLYIKRIECIRFFLYLYIKLENPIDNLIPAHEYRHLDSLIICALLRFNKENDGNHTDFVEVDSLIHSIIPNNEDSTILNLIEKRISGLQGQYITDLCNDSLYSYQACDLIIIYLKNNLGHDYEGEKYNFLSINNLIYTIIFQNNPLKLEFNSEYYAKLDKYELTPEIRGCLHDSERNRISSINRDYYRNS